jgi:hypothetical protein
VSTRFVGKEPLDIGQRTSECCEGYFSYDQCRRATAAASRSSIVNGRGSRRVGETLRTALRSDEVERERAWDTTPVNTGLSMSR